MLTKTKLCDLRRFYIYSRSNAMFNDWSQSSKCTHSKKKIVSGLFKVEIRSANVQTRTIRVYRF